jgi:formate dehydrogenase assembly factor FdhD
MTLRSDIARVASGVRGQAHVGAERREITRALPEETPVAITVNGSTQAVMMASPADIEDFAIGFALSEGIVEAPDQIDSVEALEIEGEFGGGIEARLWVAEALAEALGERRRAMLGPVGCGLCGIDSLAQAMRALPKVAGGVDFTCRRGRGRGRCVARPSADARPDPRRPCRRIPAAGAGDHPCPRGRRAATTRSTS